MDTGKMTLQRTEVPRGRRAKRSLQYQWEEKQLPWFSTAPQIHVPPPKVLPSLTSGLVPPVPQFLYVYSFVSSLIRVDFCKLCPKVS